ncbi:MAG: 1-acyl-sn-glycerol-3-phosphate acyltransferase, partial [Rhodanobacteraceae bacterium]
MEVSLDRSTRRRDPLRPLRYLWRVPAILLLVVGGCLLGAVVLPSGPPRPRTFGAKLIRGWSRAFLG